MTDLKRILDAQATLKAQFDEHECDLNAARAKWQGSRDLPYDELCTARPL